MENRGKRQAASIFGGMGFYIALLVCVIAAGVVGYRALLSSEVDPAENPVEDPVEIVQNVDNGEEEPPAPVSEPDEGDAKLLPLAVDELAGQAGGVLIENVLVQRPVHHRVDPHRETRQIFPADGGLAAEGVARLHNAVVA